MNDAPPRGDRPGAPESRRRRLRAVLRTFRGREPAPGSGLAEADLGPASAPTAIERALGVRLADRELYDWSLTHRSYAYEHGGLPTNERLEFLGDAVLGLVVTDLIYRSFPDLQEGQLAKLRAATVNMAVLADVARGLGVGDAVRLGRGEELSGGRDKSSILADTLEAILGAVYLDGGLHEAAALIRRLTEPRILATAGGDSVLDYKTSLQELTAALGALPTYVVESHGPDHAKEFTATVLLGGAPHGSGRGRTKKEAEQRAARVAYQALAVGNRRAGAGAPAGQTARTGADSARGALAGADRGSEG